MINVGEKIDFVVHNQAGEQRSLSDYAGKKLVLYFYPKDDTSGCTMEAKDFSELLSQFVAKGAHVVGVSRDSAISHCKFIAKHDLTVELLSDEEGGMVEAYGVWVEKAMYGKKYMGIERTTLLLGADGAVQQIWRKVQVKGHAQAVLDSI